MAPEPPSPSASTVLLPFLGSKSRRGSLASISSRAAIDKDVLSQALDDIHTSASKSETLTSFHDYDGGGGRAGPKELVSGGVSGLYNRFKQSVSGATQSKDIQRSSRIQESKDLSDTHSLRSSLSIPRGKSNNSGRGTTPDAVSLPNTSNLPSPAPSPSKTESDVAASTPGPRKSQPNDGTSRAVTGTNGSLPSIQTDLSSEEFKHDSELRPAESRSQRGPGQEHMKGSHMDLDGGEKVTQYMPRSISHPEAPQPDPPQSALKPLLEPETEDGIDDSDYADDGTILVLPSDNSVTNIGTEPDISNAKELRLTLQTGTQRPPMTHVGVSHLPGFAPSRGSSLVDVADTTSLSSTQASVQRPFLDPSPNLNAAFQRRRFNHKHMPNVASHLNVSPHLQRKILRKEFWMLDENARVCFSCGQSFSTFRRKHHCRTCGQIFDAKCTSLVPGKPFGQLGTIRLCKPCEKMIFEGDEDDDSSTLTDDDEYSRSPAGQFMSDEEDMQSIIDGFSRPDTAVTTPSIGIPVSRRNREAKRRSAVIEFDTQPTLARPSSSHSLISLSRRPRSSSHRRRHSRHTSARGLRSNLDEHGPFSQYQNGDAEGKASLPAFHNDNVIDPDLAPFLSDDGSEEEDQTNIMSAIENGSGVSPGERERFGFSGLFASALRKGRSRHGDKGTSSVRGVKEDDAQSHAPKSPKHSRSRNFSISSTHNRPSPRRSRSALQFTAWGEGQPENRPISSLAVPQTTISKAMFSSAIQNQDRLPHELNTASHDHARRLLSQLLRDAQIPSAHAWGKALMPIILQCTDDVDPDVQQGDDMDIRQYIKLKKVPGGRPIDTSYISGVVFSKNIAVKAMARSIHHPRIAIVTFAIEYARHEAHFMSLEPVIAQEREYLQNLVGRIAALRPTVLLVQRHVSGLALRLLEEAGITVVCNIKESVLAAVARVTQTVLIKSIDKLGINPSHLGRCDGFEVKTFIGEGLRKTYIYLSGCEPDLGCTIVLRGADKNTLRSIKRIVEFMCYVAYNLKLENYLMRDQFISIPTTAHGGLKAHDDVDNEKPAEMSALYEGLRSAREALKMNDNVDGDAQFKYANFEESVRNRILSASPFVVYMQPYLLTKLRDLESRMASFETLRDLYAAADEDGETEEKSNPRQFELVKSDMVNVPPSKHQPKAVREFLHAVHEAQLEKALHSFQTSERQWESFISGQVNPFDPFSHQKIILLYSTISSITSAPCSGPDLVRIGFYSGFNRAEGDSDEDLPLGQYIEDLCLSANSTCRECSKKMYDHHRQYVHGYGQLDVSIVRQTAKMRGYSNSILMWSTCRICAHETTVTPMSDHTWKYSFAKYLEMSFWSGPLHPRAGACKHDIHKDYLRYFSFQDLVVKFQYDAIDIYDVIVPRSRVTWKVEADLNVKNEQFSRFVRRLELWTESIKKRLDAINVDTLEEKKALEATEFLQQLRQRADTEHEQVLQKLQQKYATSRYYELIPLNRALRLMDENAIAWDATFSEFENDYFPSETDIRKLATLQLRSMFLESQPVARTAASDDSDVEDMIDGKAGRRRTIQVTPGKRDEILSEKAHDVLSSVIEEQKISPSGSSSLTEPTNSEDIIHGEDNIRSTSPLTDQEQVVKREDVKHLDLAIPFRTSEEPSTSGGQVGTGQGETEQPASSSTANNNDAQIPFATQPKPLSTGLLERIEQIRSAQLDGTSDIEVGESKIPRLADLKRRDVGPPPPPPLVRAQSSPNRLSLHGMELHSDGSNDSISGSTAEVEASPHERRLGERLGVTRLANKVGKLAPSLIPRSVPKTESKIVAGVSALTRHFDQLSREFERQRLRERQQRAMRSRQSRANPLASSRPVVEVYENATDAVGEKARDESGLENATRDDEIDRRHMDETVTNSQTKDDTFLAQEAELQDDSHHGSSESLVETEVETIAEGDTSETEALTLRSRQPSDPMSGSSSATLTSPTSVPDMVELGPDINISENRKKDYFKYLTAFWSTRSASGWSNLEYPLHANEHVFEDSDIIVRDDEPSSLIALSLSCADYKNKMKAFRSGSDRPTPSESQASVGGANETGQQKELEETLTRNTGTHLKYSFTHGPVVAFCKIFYAESFDALRRRCGVADRFIESMSRCLKFDSKGGKTKSLFLKTLDNRFIIKSLQEVELKAFTKFAPDYFDFMSWTLFHGVPSVIAKMFGLFQVNIINPASNVNFSYYLLVMENLFYERSPNRRFDLKGSMRNRKIESTGQADEVLLDENLVETIFEKPLFMREQSCRLLQASVFNDTLWLCKQNVMDYSLMAGFDDAQRELVVGIIDCIRTYTWDKKLESWIKDRGKNRPTITSPKDYRNRFRVSMTQYVLQAPSCWHQFQAQIAAPKKLKDAERDETGYMEADRDEQGRTVYS